MMETYTKIKTTIELYSNSEFGTLKEVLLCPPKFMKIREVINETQKHYLNENIDTNLAGRQHQHLLETLQQHEIQTHLLAAHPELPEQVFTRDIGFTIGDTLFAAQMKRKIRQGESKSFQLWLEQHGIQAVDMNDEIEGGDVIVDGNAVWVGLSNRTTKQAIEELRSHLPNYDIKELKFDPAYLHLDCVFQPISHKKALCYPPAFTADTLELIQNQFELIEVDKEEQFTLATNVLSIGEKKIISLTLNKKTNEQLRQHGFNVIPIDISEIIKSGGSFRCVTLPLKRLRV